MLRSSPRFKSFPTPLQQHRWFGVCVRSTTCSQISTSRQVSLLFWISLSTHEWLSCVYSITTTSSISGTSKQPENCHAKAAHPQTNTPRLPYPALDTPTECINPQSETSFGPFGRSLNRDTLGSFVGYHIDLKHPVKLLHS